MTQGTGSGSGSSRLRQKTGLSRTFKHYQQPAHGKDAIRTQLLPPLHRDHCHGIHKRDDHTTPSAGMQATTPPSHPSLSLHTCHHHCLICRHASYFFSFSFFFIPFLTNVTETLFTLCTRSSNPHLSTT